MNAAPAALPVPSSEEEATASVRSLRMLMLLCMLVPLALLGIFGYYRYLQVHDEAEVRLDRALRIANEHALKVLETNQTLLRHIGDLAGGNGAAGNQDRARLHAQIRELARDKPQIRAIRVTDAEGALVATSRGHPPSQGQWAAALESFRFHAQQRGNGPLFFSELTDGGTVFEMSRGRTGPDGRFAGTVSVSLAPAYFARFHADLSADEPGLAITMFRQDGIVYSRWPPLRLAPPKMAASSPVLSRVLRGETSGIIRGVSSLDRQERLLLFRRVGDYPVYLGTGLELGAIRSGWLREMGLIGAFALVPVLGLLIAALAAMKRAGQAREAARRLHQESHARVQVEEALRQAQKMEAVGRLTGGVAHDFNNALMVISANLHMLKLTQPQAAGKQTEAIARAVDNATKLTRQLLAFSRRQALSPELVRLQELLPSLKDLMAPVLGRQVPLVVVVAEDTAPIKVDLAELELALINLAVNAKDAMPASGSFRLQARNAPPPGLMPGPAVVIEATDSGSGIAPELLARVFEPFFTTKPVGEGTGLGLAQVYGFCQRSGGHAEIRSTPGAGTTVAMYFPAQEGRPPPPQGRDEAAQSALDLRVLLVEDNADVAAAVQPVLQALGCTVRHFDAAAPAIVWLDANPSAVDAVLTDVVMPGAMDGLALARYVRERHSRLHLVVMTGYAEHLDEITRHGFEMLAKPWNAASLARALRAAGTGGGQAGDR
ncbi:MAG: response regulator [Ramlibacter sp.]|uniref:hybrid sensor histidine kinase/response regulator n=1 Tax=Ramlibacter sp. TaxID=1917967 RepID=UPI002632DC73|nr:hybrid sensor histidine kinase/response regulator [Ramlibacter sp.]MDB5750284.1 response regulator [Ramlibacter sp.]